MSPHEVDRSGTAASHDSVVPPISRPPSEKSMDEADLGARTVVKNPARSCIFRWLEQKFADTRSLTISAAGWVIALVAMVKVDLVIGSLVVGGWLCFAYPRLDPGAASISGRPRCSTTGHRPQRRCPCGTG